MMHDYVVDEKRGPVKTSASFPVDAPGTKAFTEGVTEVKWEFVTMLQT